MIPTLRRHRYSGAFWEQGSQWKPFTAVRCERFFCFFYEFNVAEYNAK